MTDWIKKALTRTIVPKTKRQSLTIPPDKRLLYGVKFAITLTLSLSALEIAHMIFLQRWNSEIFSAITGLTGTITGIFITQKT
jgi:hypothetical protein